MHKLYTNIRWHHLTMITVTDRLSFLRNHSRQAYKSLFYNLNYVSKGARHGLNEQNSTKIK